jgi:hypothetical protein
MSVQEEEEKIFQDRKSEEHLANTVFFIEASSFERIALWKEYQDKRKWVECCSGFTRNVGFIKEDCPVHLELFFVLIDRQTVCFYTSPSRYVDWTMIESYLDTKYPRRWDAGSRNAREDIERFHCCLQAIDEKNKKQ